MKSQNCSMVSSDNYNLNLENSDKDYKIIEVPSFIDLWYNKTLNRQIDDNTSVWDIREFAKFLLKANPNAIELFFPYHKNLKIKN